MQDLKMETFDAPTGNHHYNLAKSNYAHTYVNMSRGRPPWHQERNDSTKLAYKMELARSTSRILEAQVLH